MTRLLAVALLVAAPVQAQDFSANSEARPWNLWAETPARFEARVVDILCELSGDCPADCGGGARQLGLLRTADNVLVFPNKNSQPLFTGAVAELQPFCGMDVEVDGLMIEDPELGARNIYLVQMIRSVGDADWTSANRWTDVWAEANPDAAAAEGPWFRKDPRVAAEIEAEGWFGLGLARDEEIIDELFR